MSVGTNIQTVNFNNIQPKMQTNFKAQSSPVKDYPPDTVEINGTKKTGMSNGAKVGIGLGILGTAVLAIGLIAKGRGSQAKEVVKHIDLKEAKSVEEAIKWGKENLGITNYEKYENIEILNWINKGLTQIQNNAKLKNGIFTDISFESLGSKGFACTRDGNKLIFNKDVISNFDNILSKNINTSIHNGVFVSNNEKLELYKFFKNGDTAKEIEELVNKYQKNINSLNWNDKVKLYEYISKLSLVTDKITKLPPKEAQNILKTKIYKPQKVSSHDIIIHETGHVLHQKNIGSLDAYYKMGKLQELEGWSITDKSVIEEFLNDKSIQKTAGKISEYAKESPLEFVAETFVELINGNKLSDDVMALYKKYNGPMI